MIFIYKDRLIQLEWSIFRGTSQVQEDFSRALVKLFLVGNYEKYAIPVTAEGGTLVAQMPQDLPDGAYSLEAIWVKNYNNLFPVKGTGTPTVGLKNIRYPGSCHNDYGMIHPWDHRSNDRCLMRSRKDYVFAVTSYPGEETAVNEDSIVTVRINSAVATYGYDGLSAYELAVMRGDFNGTEGEYLEQLKYELKVATDKKLGGITASEKTDKDTVEVKIDPETGKLYVPPSEAGEIEVATETTLGGIRAAAKTDNETVEVKIDSKTGKLYVPQGVEGTTNYERLNNKPMISGVELEGNKTLDELGAASLIELMNKVDIVPGKSLSSNDYTNNEKSKLSNIEEGATRTLIDSLLSTDSNNPVQNSVVTAEIYRIKNKVEAVSSIDTNFIGYFESSDKLPTPNANSWALVGSLNNVSVYAYYETEVPGMSIGWNSLNSLGNYDLSNFDKFAKSINSSLESTSDLEISDEQGNVLSQFANGHIKTKNFDSSKVPNIDSQESVSDLEISDEQGNVLVRFTNGHVKTKNFDSSKTRPLSGNSYISIIYDGLFCIRENTTFSNGRFTKYSGKYCSNKIPCTNATMIIVSSDVSLVLFKKDGNYTECSGTSELDSDYDSFIYIGNSYSMNAEVCYASEQDIDLSGVPLYYRVPVNQTRLTDIGGTSSVEEDSENYNSPLAICYVNENFRNKKTVLVGGGLGKKLTVDGWDTASTGWNIFFQELKEKFNVISVEGGRPVTTSDFYYNGKYVIPSLGNPFIMQAFNAAHGKMVDLLGLNEFIGIVGCSQGGIFGLNYQFVFGNVKVIVECGGFTNLKKQGWDGQGDDIRKYFEEWYGMSDTYDAELAKGFDPYARIISYDSTPVLLNCAPIKCIYGGADTTAPPSNAEEIVNAVKNANGIAEMRVIEGANHDDVAGHENSIVRKETILFLERFL